MKLYGLFNRHSKIVGTIGPATGSAAVIERLIRGGLNIARLNLSHGSYQTHTDYVRTIRKISRKLGVKVAILIDLPGPKYRIGALLNGQVTLRKGSRMVLTVRDIEGDAALIPVNPPNLHRDAQTGDNILLDDGALQLKVLAKSGTEIECRVTRGGVLRSGRGLVIPGKLTSSPFITDSLREHIAFAIRQQPDYLAISFICDAGDVTSVRKIVKAHGADTPIIAKIERKQAVSNFDRILAVSDGIMVARGDLGVDIPLERVPLVQKDIIRKCNRAGKPVITATQMLESMIDSPRPTRAEVTDIANAIFDGTDATMLSAETSIGKYPVAAVRTMAIIAQTTEAKLPYDLFLSEKRNWIEQETDELISYSASHTAYHLGAKAIVAFTQSGSTAIRVSKYRPRVPILAVTTNIAVSGKLSLYWGVYPCPIETASNVNQLFASGAKLAKDTGLAKTGDLIVITGGIPIGVTGSTNLLKVEKIL